MLDQRGRVCRGYLTLICLITLISSCFLNRPALASIKLPSLIIQNEHRTTIYGTGATPKRRMIIKFSGEVDIISRGALTKDGQNFALTSRCPTPQTCISVAWQPFTANNATLLSYAIYKSEDPDNFPLEVSFTAKLDQPVFTDTDVIPGKTYYYLIRAVIERQLNEQLITAIQTPNDTPLRVIKVTAAPDDMVLLHRWTANQAMCRLLQRQVGQKKGADPQENFRCEFNGLGSVLSNGQPCSGQDKDLLGRNAKCYYDFGRDLFVDLSPLPDLASTAPAAFASCQAPAISKRLATRFELMAMAAAEEFNTAQKEIWGSILGQGYFWGADQLTSAQQFKSTDPALFPAASLLFDQTILPATSGNFKDFAFFNPAWGFPLLDHATLASDDRQISYNFSQDAQLYFSPLKPEGLDLGPAETLRYLVGGQQSHEGPRSLHWATENNGQIATRCVVENNN